MTNEEEELSEKIKRQNQAVENFMQLLREVDEGEKVSSKALVAYGRDGEGFIQVDGDSIIAVKRNEKEMVVDRYKVVNKDSVEMSYQELTYSDDTIVRLEERIQLKIDQQAAKMLGNIVSSAMQSNLGNGSPTNKLGYIG